MANLEVILPSMGEGVTEAEVVRWLKASGDSVAEGDPILEVSTDKVDTEVVSPYSGVLGEPLVAEGDTIEVNQVICTVAGAANGAAALSAAASSATASAAAPSASPTPSAAAPSAAAPSAAVSLGKKPYRSSPVVRKMAQDNGVALDQVAGTGVNGRITKKDLEAYLAGTTAPGVGVRASAAAPSTTAGGGESHSQTMAKYVKTTNQDGQEFLEGVRVRREPMSRIRKKIAEHMVDSVRISPHVTTVFEIDLHAVAALRGKVKGQFKQKHGFNLTYTPFFIKAAIEAIGDFPEINSSIDGTDILYKDAINIGCAVATDKGLLVPVIKDAAELNLFGIAKRLHELADKARSSNLAPDDLKGGTFTITNPGGYGSLTSNPIISQPQVAILGIGAIVKRPVVVDEMIAIRPMMLMSITFDHRVIDGEQGAKFLAKIKDVLENFTENPL